MVGVEFELQIAVIIGGDLGDLSEGTFTRGVAAVDVVNIRINDL
jgi:hypothetical protein